MIKDIAEKFISLRGPTGLIIGALHQDQHHCHVHLIQSGVQLGTGLAARISKQEFQEIKRTLNEYQKDKFPELVSLPEHGKSKNTKSRSMGDLENLKAERRQQEDILQHAVETAYAMATSKDAFIAQIRQEGHEPYFRNDRLQGLKYNGEEKFRLSRFGISEKELDELEHTAEDRKELRTKEQLQERWKEFNLEAKKSVERSQEQSRLDQFEELEKEQTNNDRDNKDSAQDLQRESQWEPDIAGQDIDEWESEYEEMEDDRDHDDGRDEEDVWGFDHDSDSDEIDR